MFYIYNICTHIMWHLFTYFYLYSFWKHVPSGSENRALITCDSSQCQFLAPHFPASWCNENQIFPCTRGAIAPQEETLKLGDSELTENVGSSNHLSLPRKRDLYYEMYANVPRRKGKCVSESWLFVSYPRKLSKWHLAKSALIFWSNILSLISKPYLSFNPSLNWSPNAFYSKNPDFTEMWKYLRIIVSQLLFELKYGIEHKVWRGAGKGEMEFTRKGKT